MATASLRNAILCDRVYQDDYELAYINRIYPGKIILETIPSVLQLYIYCAFSVETDKPARLEFKLEGPKVTAGGAGAFDESSDHFEIIAPFFTYLDAPSEITFRWRLDEGKWSRAVKWQVQVHEEAVHLDTESVNTLRMLFNARGHATRLLDRADIRSIDRPVSDSGKSRKSKGKSAHKTVDAAKEAS